MAANLLVKIRVCGSCSCAPIHNQPNNRHFPVVGPQTILGLPVFIQRNNVYRVLCHRFRHSYSAVRDTAADQDHFTVERKRSTHNSGRRGLVICHEDAAPKITVNDRSPVGSILPLPYQTADHCRQILVYHGHVRKRPAVLQLGILLTGTDKAADTRYIGTADISG